MANWECLRATSYIQTIRSLAERDNANIAHWSEFDEGGHFAVLERPDSVVADLRAFFA